MNTIFKSVEGIQKALFFPVSGIKDIKEIGDDTIVTLLVTDERVDRDGDVVLASGVDAANLLDNGAILYGHNAHGEAGLPVGTPLKFFQQNGASYLEMKFAKKGTWPFIDAVISLVEQKILKGVSIGFLGFEWYNNDTNGRTFVKSELVDVSLTPIPANVGARILGATGKDKGDGKSVDDAGDDADEREEAQVAEPDESSESEKAFAAAVAELRKLF